MNKYCTNKEYPKVTSAFSLSLSLYVCSLCTHIYLAGPTLQVLVACKIDQDADVQITKEQGMELAASHGMQFFEVSHATCAGGERTNGHTQREREKQLRK